MMVKPRPQGLESLLDFRKIEKPTRVRINLTFANDLDTKAMPVQPGTLMPGRRIRQAMGGLKPELANKTYLSAALGVGDRLLVVASLLFLGSLDHTCLVVRQVGRVVFWYPRMALWAAVSSRIMIANPSPPGTIHECNIILKRTEYGGQKFPIFPVRNAIRPHERNLRHAVTAAMLTRFRWPVIPPRNRVSNRAEFSPGRPRLQSRVQAGRQRSVCPLRSYRVCLRASRR